MLKTNNHGTIYLEIDGIITEKTCRACGEIKEMDHFGNHKNGLGGKLSKCKPCFAEYNKNRYERNPDYDKKRYLEVIKGSEAKKEADKRYYEKNKERISEQRKVAYNKRSGSGEERREASRINYQNNKEKIKGRSLDYYQKNRDEQKERQLKYYHENKDRINERKRKKRMENKNK